MLTNLVRAGLARVTRNEYQPWPTVYDGFFPDGTLLTAPVRPPPTLPARVTPRTEPAADACAAEPDPNA